MEIPISKMSIPELAFRAIESSDTSIACPRGNCARIYGFVTRRPEKTGQLSFSSRGSAARCWQHQYPIDHGMMTSDHTRHGLSRFQ
jgi:hypothetical protein